jgi:hyperosmotically inducible periplasmic protein
MRAKGLGLTTLAVCLVLCGCVAAVIGNAPDSGTAADSRARADVQGDAALGSAVRVRIAADAVLRRAPITVSASGGTVTLRGTVASAAQRAFAERTVRSVAGVVAVNNQLEVN